MRVLFHHRIASTDGQFVHLTELTRALRELGHEVLIVGPKIGESGALGETNSLISTLKKAIPSALYEIMEFLYSFIAVYRLWKAARTFKPDVVYERYNLHLHAGRFVAKAIRRPFILEVNAPLAEERDVYGKLALKSFARWSDGVIWRSAQMALPVTDVLADHLRKQGVKESQITVLHNGADLSQYQQTRAQCRQQIAGIGENDVVFGFVGFIRRWHGLSKVVDFIKSRPDLPIRAIFVGDGREDKDELQLQINKLGLTDKIQITGFVNRERIPTYVGAFDVALQPASTLYASPLKLFEYMAAGCAILAPATPNIKEVLKHEASGLLFDPDSIESMVDCFQHLCDDPLLRTAVGQNAKTLCKTFPYTWENNARIVVNIAEKLATKASLSK